MFRFDYSLFCSFHFTDRIRHWECISSGVAIETDSVSSRSSSGVYSLNEHSPPPARIESFFAENLVYLKGQGPDQAVVKMKRDGTLIFAELDTKTGSGGLLLTLYACMPHT